jgi:hypothetical protein
MNSDFQKDHAAYKSESTPFGTDPSKDEVVPPNHSLEVDYERINVGVELTAKNNNVSLNTLDENPSYSDDLKERT